MRSNFISAVLALSFSVASTGCETREKRFDEVCGKLRDCTGFVDANACEQQLKDAIRDERLTPTGLTRCAMCLDAQTDGESSVCDKIIVDRNCDTACSEVPFVLQARTEEKTRNEACSWLENNCHEFKALSKSCGQALDETYQVALQVQLAHDQDVAACAACILTPSELKNLDACSNAISNCTKPCVKVDPIATRLRDAQAALTYCDRVRGCLETAGAAGNPDSADAGPNSELDASSVLPREQCYLGLLSTAEPTDLVMCSDCAQSSLDCDALAQTCVSCKEIGQ